MKIKLNDTTYTQSAPIIKPHVSSPLHPVLSLHDEFSSFNNYKRESVKSNSSNLSFTAFLYKKPVEFDIEKVLKLTDKHLGANVRGLFEDLKNSKYADKLFNVSGDKVNFTEKSIPHLIFEGLVYPFWQLPKDLINGTVDFLRKHGGPLKKWASKVYDGTTLKKFRQDAKLDSKVNALRGLFEDITKLAEKVKEGPLSKEDLEKGMISEATLKDELFGKIAKMFNPKTGKYDTKHERSLNRIVSGFIPALFLANDAYNLSRMCNDNEKEATHEKKVRFRQETSRVLAQAYLTLITMGAIQRHINSSKVAVMVNVGLTALFTESISRLLAGKPVSRLSAEDAKTMNSKSSEKKNDETLHPSETYKNVFFKSNSKPKSIETFDTGAVATNVQHDSVSNKSEATANKKNKDQKAPLLSFETFFKTIGALIVAGFAMKGLRQNKAIEGFFNKISKSYDKFYKRLTSNAEHKISSENFKELLAKLGGEFDAKKGIYSGKGAKFKELANQYYEIEQELRSDLISKKIEAMLTVKPSEIAKEIKALEGLAGKSKEDAIKKIMEKANTSAMEMQKVLEGLSGDDLKKLIEEYNGVLSSVSNHIDIAKLAEQKSTTSLTELPDKVKAIVKEHREFVHLGAKDKPYIKPLVDFIVGPFKFIFGLLKAPYEWTSKLIDKLTGKLPNPESKTGKFKVFATSVDNLSNELFNVEGHKKASFNQKDFDGFVSDNMLKAFNKDNVSGIPNSDLANLAKTAVFAATLPFLMSDNYNIVMLKSNGEDKEGAELKYKERLVQESSRFFYATLLISLFNSTFQKQYHNSLLGMSVITAACTTTGEILNRKSIGVPVTKHSRSEIEEMERARENASPLVRGYYRFMARLTGKKSLKEQQAAKQQAAK